MMNTGEFTKKTIAVMKEDIRAVQERDPAARGTLEVILSYPGLHAIWMYRVANHLERKGIPLIPRMLSMLARLLTGIEIHQSAVIGRGLFIDHGMGVVIGETAGIGDNVSIFQGVTLGGTGKERGKRHPTIEDNVVLAADATVLGPITIGRDSRVGAGSVVLKDVPPNCTVVGVPGRIKICNGERVSPIDLHHERLPDPVLETLLDLERRIERLETRTAALPEQEEARRNEETLSDGKTLPSGK